MNQHLNTIRQHGCDAWRQWLGTMLVDNPNGLGWELVEGIPGPNNTHAADTLLAAAEALGWIERTALAPSISQQAFFGLQYPGGVHKAPTAIAFHGQLHMYRIIDREAVKAYVGTIHASTYNIGDAVKYRASFVRQIQGGSRMSKARGIIVGFGSGSMSHFPRVDWNDDPTTEPACQAPVDEPPKCVTGKGGARHECACPRVPYAPRAVSPTAIVRAP